MLSNLISNLNPGNDISFSEKYLSGISNTGRNLVDKFNSSGIGKFFGVDAISKLSESKTNTSINKTKIKNNKNNKNPHFTTLRQGPILPLRRGDSEADILAKMYRFMFKVRDEEKKEYQLFKDFEQERAEESEIRHKRLVKAIKDSKGIEVVKDEEPSFLKKLLDMIKGLKDSLQKLTGAVFKIVTSLPKMIMMFLKSRFFGKFLGRRGLGKKGGGIGVKGVVGAAAVVEMAMAFPKVTEKQTEEQAKSLKSITERQRGPSERIKEEQTYKPEIEDDIKNGKLKEYKFTSLESGNEVVVPLTDEEATKLVQNYTKLGDKNTSFSDQDAAKQIIRDITTEGLKRFKSLDQAEISLLEYPIPATALRMAKEAGIDLAEGVSDIVSFVAPKLGVDEKVLQEQMSKVRESMGLEKPDEPDEPDEMEKKEEGSLIQQFKAMTGLDLLTEPTEEPKKEEKKAVPDESSTESLPETLPEVNVTGDRDRILNLWKERESLTGIVTSQESKEQVLDRMIGSDTRDNSMRNFERQLTQDIENIKKLKGITPNKLEVVPNDPTKKYNIPMMMDESEQTETTSTPTILNNTQNNNIGGQSKFMDTNPTVSRNDNESITDTLMRIFVPV